MDSDDQIMNGLSDKQGIEIVSSDTYWEEILTAASSLR